MTQDAIETKVVSMLDALQNGAVEVAGQAVKYAPDVTNAMLDVIRIDNLQSLIWGTVFLLLFILSTIFMYITTKKCLSGSDWSGWYVLIFPTFIGSCTGLSTTLLYIWTWVGIFQPKLYIAHLLVEKVMK